MDEEEEMNQEVLGLDSSGSRHGISLDHVVGTVTSRLGSLNSSLADKLDWQANYKSVAERNTVIFNTETFADVHFLVGCQSNAVRIPAHRMILATGSSVFEAMFYGGLAHDADDIEIPDVEPEAFLILLRYLYSDSLDLEMDTVLATLYAAKKYIVPNLVRECVRLLETRLSASNACQLLSQSRLFDEAGLMRRCWQVVDAQATEALAAPGFADVDPTTFAAVLSRDTLHVDESMLFRAALRWADSECMRRGVRSTPSAQRAVLGDSLYLLRLPTMTMQQFADGPAQSGVFTLQESHDVFLYLSAACKPQVAFPCIPRRGLPPHHCRRFLSAAYRSNQWRYRGRCDSIQFSVDKCIFLAGLRLYGSSSRPADYKAAIEIKRGSTVLARAVDSYHADGSSGTFPVNLESSLQLLPDTWYTASVVVAGEQLTYFGQEGQTDVMADGRVHFQFQCSSDSTNGTGVQGGQIPELVYYC